MRKRNKHFKGDRTFVPEILLVSVSKRPFSAISASVCEISCAAYVEYASAQFLDFLDLAKNFTF